MELRPYTPDDAAACLALFDANVPAYFAPEERAGFVEFLATMPVSYLVLLDGASIVGCGGVGFHDGEARMCWGIVDGARHRRGLGTRLLLERLVAGAELGAVRAGLDTIPLTVPFFERFGFVVVREVDDGYGPGLHRRDMQLALDTATVRRLREHLAAIRALPR